MKTYAAVEIEFHSFLTSAFDVGQQSASRRGRFSLGQNFKGPLNECLGGPQNRSGCLGEEIKLLLLPGFLFVLSLYFVCTALS